MRRTLAGAALLMACAVAAHPVHAQVTVNPGALDLLPAPKPAPKPAARPAPHPPASHQPAKPAAPAPSAAAKPGEAKPGETKPGETKPAATPTPAPAQPAATGPAAKPALPAAPPDIAALPPPAPLPPPRPQAPPVIPMDKDAPGSVSPASGGIRVTFGPDRAELNPVTEAAIRSLAKNLRENPAETVNIYAYAAGSSDDVSAPRRLSLARALAARAVLVNEGIASTRIYPRALGATGGDAGADRVDIVPGPPGPPPGATPVKAQAAPVKPPAAPGQ